MTRVVVDLFAGLVRMSGTQLEGGRFGPAKRLAQQIIDAKQEEFTEMDGVLTCGIGPAR